MHDDMNVGNGKEVSAPPVISDQASKSCEEWGWYLIVLFFKSS